jgi:peptidyl-prolyl cis-trans isomerase SurA
MVINMTETRCLIRRGQTTRRRRRDRLLVVAVGLVVLSWGIGLWRPTWLIAAERIVVDRMIAEVNNDVITLYDLNQEMQPYQENLKGMGYPAEKERELLFKIRSDLLNQLIDRKLADQEIERNKIQVSETEIDKTIERIKETRHYTDEDLRAGLARQGVTYQDYRKEVREQILRQKLVNIEVKSKIVITDEDIQAYYDQHKEKYSAAKKYHLWNIYVQLPQYAPESDKRAAYQAMEAVYGQLKGGRSFEAVFQDISGASSVAKGSDLGVFQLDELASDLRDVVRGMSPGEYSRVLESGFGYQIIYLQRILEADAKSVEAVRSEIQQTLYDEAINKRYQEWLDNLRQQAHIRVIQ